jgi:hypothetical protein
MPGEGVAQREAARKAIERGACERRELANAVPP